MFLSRIVLLLALSAVLVTAAACGGAATRTLSLTATATPQASPFAAPTSSPTPSPVTRESTPVFYLEVLSPQDESVVRVAAVEVRGRTVPDAVVSVNGAAIEVDSTGSFSATVELAEGPNTVEVIASDFQGHQASRVLSIIYVR